MINTEKEIIEQLNILFGRISYDYDGGWKDYRVKNKTFCYNHKSRFFLMKSSVVLMEQYRGQLRVSLL